MDHIPRRDPSQPLNASRDLLPPTEKQREAIARQVGAKLRRALEAAKISQPTLRAFKAYKHAGGSASFDEFRRGL